MSSTLKYPVIRKCEALAKMRDDYVRLIVDGTVRIPDNRSLGRAIMDVCQEIMEKFAINPFKTPGPVVKCPHSDAIRSDQSLLFHLGCELHLCDECHDAMIAEMKLSTMPYDKLCPVTGETTTVHAKVPGLFD